ncbi:MAG TPA: kelch repeat-containing protein, partial [Umezawaea sp.]|nr:kelch repeat-containing protein [Umezawaea sp.]
MTTETLAAEAWSPAPDHAVAACWRGQHDNAVVLAGGTKILVAGGADAAGAGLRQTAVYDLAQGTWSATAMLGTVRQLHALALLPDGKVLATGGRSSATGPPLRTAEVFDPAANSWRATDDMAVGRFGHSATALSNGLVLVAGGTGQRAGGGVVALRSSELFDPEDGGSWQPVEDDMTDARTGHTAVPLQSGQKVLVCGG